ncbi:MAG: hypothetical protein GXY15_09270 [Candidatus Hydrogenedentes bacterium]|nr:hypothetical protein [Candidatus Hydrogenedentota bacterium]
MRHDLTRKLWAGAFLLAWAMTAGAAPLERAFVLDDFVAPEGVAVDPETGTAYVSNINSAPETYWQDTGKGFISRMAPGGKLDRLKWVDSTPEHVLNQPKGMAVMAGWLHVADNKRLLSFALADGKPGPVVEVPGAERLNDVAACDGKVYVSDVVTGKIFRMDTKAGNALDVVAEIEGVNGLYVHDGVLFAVSWTLHDLYTVPQDGSGPPKPFHLSNRFKNLDGLHVLPDGTFLVSDYAGGKVFVVSANRRRARPVAELSTPADIGVDPARGWLYVPQLESGKVAGYRLGKLAAAGEGTPLALLEYDQLRGQIVDRNRGDNARLAREAHRPEALILETDRTPVDIVWRRTRALLAHLQTMPDAPDLAHAAAALERLRPDVERLQREETPDPAELRGVFGQITALRREIAFANPLLDFQDILFLKRHRSIYEHMCDQYYGITARPGGGLFVLEDAFGGAPRVRDVLAEAVVGRGRLKGEALRGGVSPAVLSYDGEGLLTQEGDPGGGAFLSPELSYDGKQVLFSYVECRGDPRHNFRREEPGNYWENPWDPGRAYHVFKVNMDGTGLEQLTDGPWNDIHPCWMPDGRVVFVSERRGGFLRCGRVCPTYTLYQMNADGGFVRPFSYHETHEWLPSVDHNGMVAYTRWDYVDRDSDIAHHLWLAYPDGRNPRSPHGNYPRVRESRPWMEMSIRAIPGSHKYIATAATHHGQHFGSLITIDPRIEDDHSAGQLRRITPEAMFPEAEEAPGVPRKPRGGGGKGQVYGTPWPLNEDFYLAVYDPGERHYGIYLVDGFGNRELVHRDPDIACSNPIPLKPRPTPPVIPVQTKYAERPEDQPKTGTVSVMNVYDSRRPFSGGTRIKELRVIQLFAKSTPAPGAPNIGKGDESIARGSLGTVPVEEDGSVHFEAPAGVSFYFQALDENGVAVQTMRSATYVHPGERLSCVGCHEHRQGAPVTPQTQPLALRKPPARLKPEPEGSFPLQFSRLVQPVIDAKCAECHRTEKNAPDLSGDTFGEHGWSQAFLSLVSHAWAKHGGNGTGLERNKTSYSIPGEVGARASKLYPMLQAGHHGVELTPEEMRRFSLWLDANSVFYGAYHDTLAQAKGEVVIPHLDMK